MDLDAEFSVLEELDALLNESNDVWLPTVEREIKKKFNIPTNPKSDSLVEDPHLSGNDSDSDSDIEDEVEDISLATVRVPEQITQIQGVEEELVTENEYDYEQFRTRPRIVTTPNDNNTIFRFFFFGCVYHYDKRDGTTLHITGNVWGTSMSCTVILTGFNAHFYLKKPAAWTTNSIQWFFTEMNTVMKTQYNWDYSMKDIVNNYQSLFVGYRFITADEFDDYQGPNKQDFIDIIVVHPRIVSCIRAILSFGDEYRWNKNALGYVDKDSFEMYEMDVDFRLRFIADMGFEPSSWYELAPLKYTVIGTHDKYRKTISTWEVKCKYTEMKKAQDETMNQKLPNWCLLSLDGEMEAEMFKFPVALKNPVVLITFCLNTYYNRDEKKYFAFALDTVAKIAGCTTFWFKTEAGLLKGFKEFILTVDPDIFHTYNGDGFDWPYFAANGQMYFGKSFLVIGTDKYSKAKAQARPWRNKTKHSFTIEGRQNIDVLKRVRDDQIPGKSFPDLRLGTVSRVLLEKTKNEFDISLLALKRKTETGRTELAEYGKTDADLPEGISRKLNVIEAYVEMSRISYVLFQECLDRALGAKIEGRLRRECFKDKKNLVLKRTLPARTREQENADMIGLVDSSEKKVKGACVISPKVGFYNYPIGVLDFASMYPSIIDALNLCLSTHVNNFFIEKLGLSENDYWRLPKFTIKHDGIVADYDPSFPAFVKKHIKHGILPKLEVELGIQRGNVKKEKEVIDSISKLIDAKISHKLGGKDAADEEITDLLKKLVTKIAEDASKVRTEDAKLKKTLEDLSAELGNILNCDPNDPGIKEKLKAHRFTSLLLDGRQLAIKYWMNGIFGQTIFKASKYSKEAVGKSILSFGRYLINYVKLFVTRKYNKLGGKSYDTDVIYGDTDSVMILLKGFVGTNEQIKAEFGVIAKDVNSIFESKGWNMIKMEFEKFYLRYIQISGKNYIGLKLDPKNFEKSKESKGVRYKKKGPPPFFKARCEKISDEAIVEGDIKKAFDSLVETVVMIKNREVTLSDLIYTHNFGSNPIKAMYHYMQKLKKSGQKIPKDVEASLTASYEKMDKGDKKKGAASGPGIVHAYNLFTKDVGRKFERGDSVFYVYREDDVRKASKSGRTFAKTQKSDLVTSPQDMLDKNLPYNVKYYIEDFLKLANKVLTFMFVDPEKIRIELELPEPHLIENIAEATKIREKIKERCESDFNAMVMKDPRIKGKKIRPHIDYSFFINEVATVKKQEQGLKKFFATTSMSALCQFCKEVEIQNVTKDDTLVCKRCMARPELEQWLEGNTEQLRAEKDKAWKRCIDCLGSDKLDPMECGNFSCDNHSYRVERRREFELAEYNERKFIHRFNITNADPTKDNELRDVIMDRFNRKNSELYDSNVICMGDGRLALFLMNYKGNSPSDEVDRMMEKLSLVYRISATQKGIKRKTTENQESTEAETIRAKKLQRKEELDF